jgi:uncharacterized spore protein YtfJ
MSANGRSVVETLVDRISQIQEKASVKTVFGEPYVVAGRTMIPVAKVRYMFAVGMGHGGPRDKETSGEGGGGGGGMKARPVAIIEVTEDSVNVKPIPDVTRLALMGMALVAWNVFWITATVRALARRRA